MSDVASWIEKAIYLREQSSFDDAMAFLLSHLQETPSDPLVYFHMARIHEDSENDTDALYAFERAVDLGLVGEDLRRPFLSMGQLYYKHGNLEKARDILVHGIRRFPGYRAYFAYYALTLHALGEHGQSVQMLMQLTLDTSADPELLAHAKLLLGHVRALTST